MHKTSRCLTVNEDQTETSKEGPGAWLGMKRRRKTSPRFAACRASPRLPGPVAPPQRKGAAHRQRRRQRRAGQRLDGRSPPGRAAEARRGARPPSRLPRSTGGTLLLSIILLRHRGAARPAGSGAGSAPGGAASGGGCGRRPAALAEDAGGGPAARGAAGGRRAAARRLTAQLRSAPEDAWGAMPGDREDEICQKALQLLAELCSVGAVENENCRDFIYYLRDRARPRLTDSGMAGGAARRAGRGGRRRSRLRAEGEFPRRRPGTAERGLLARGDAGGGSRSSPQPRRWVHLRKAGEAPRSLSIPLSQRASAVQLGAGCLRAAGRVAGNFPGRQAAAGPRPRRTARLGATLPSAADASPLCRGATGLLLCSCGLNCGDVGFALQHTYDTV